jgi:DNA replication protein DnaC
MQITWPSELRELARQMPDKVWGEVKEPEYPTDCPNCGGLGVMSVFVKADNSPNGKALVISAANGKTALGYRVRAFCPVCQDDQRGAWLIRFSGLSGNDLDVRFDDFRPLDGKKEARTRAGQLLSMTPRPVGFVSFYGGFGVGKTMLLKGLVNCFRLAGVPSVYITMADILAEVRGLFNDPSIDAAETLIRRYKHHQVLAIDEVDRVNLTGWAQETAFRLMDARYTVREAALTMLATNSDPANMPQGLEYLGSRMAEDMIHLGGLDMRQV